MVVKQLDRKLTGHMAGQRRDLGVLYSFSHGVEADVCIRRWQERDVERMVRKVVTLTAKMRRTAERVSVATDVTIARYTSFLFAGGICKASHRVAAAAATHVLRDG